MIGLRFRDMNINKYRFWAYFLIVLLVFILVKAISFALVIFFWVIKAIFFAAIIAGFVYLIDLIFDKKE